MGTFRDKGVVIRETVSGESDKMLTVLSRDRGKITLYAKGIRRQGSRNASSGALFCYSEFTVFEKGDFLSLASSDLLMGFPRLTGDYEAYVAACYAAELTDKVVRPHMESFEILKLLVRTLHALDCGFNPAAAKAVFILGLLKREGFMPKMDACVKCGGPARGYAGDGALCEACAGSGTAWLSEGAGLALNYILGARTARIFSFRVSGEKAAELLAAAEFFLRYILDIHLNAEKF